MSKKIGLLALFALAALALPAVASASPELGETSGGTFTRLAVTHNLAKTCAEESTGCIRGTNVGETVMTDANGGTLVKCTTAQMEGPLTKNSGTETEGTIETATFSGTGTNGACTGFFGSNATITTTVGNGTPYCLSMSNRFASDEFRLRGNSCANASRPITFVLDTSFGECKYERSGAVTGTYTTDVSGQDATATAASQEFPAEAGNPFGCPSKGFLDMTFTLETTNGTALYIK